MLADAFSLLCQNIRAHLDEAELLTVQDPEWSAVNMDTARGLIDALVLTIRRLMIEHKLQSGDNCRICMVGVAVPDPHDHPRLREGPARPIRGAGPAGLERGLIIEPAPGKLREFGQLNATHWARARDTPGTGTRHAGTTGSPGILSALAYRAGWRARPVC